MNQYTICISLEKSPRRDIFSKQAEEKQFAFQFFNAVTIENVRQGFVPNGCTLNLSDLKWTWSELHDPRRQNGPIMYSEIACAYSHIVVWQKALEADADFLVVFEDDVKLISGIESIEVPLQSDIFYISNRMPRNNLGEAFGYGCGTEGYVLTKSGIQKCLEIFKQLCMPIDLQLIAHAESQVIGNGNHICQFRRINDKEKYLKAFVSNQPHCYHPADATSQIS